MTASATEKRLSRLARAYGVQPSYTDASGRRIRTPNEALLGVLRALGVDVDGPPDAERALRERRSDLDRRVVDPVVVAWDGRLRDVEVRAPRSSRASVELDRGGSVRIQTTPAQHGGVRLSAPERIPTGYHTLVVETPSSRSTATVFSSPTRAPALARGSWAVFAPVYALRSRRDWGIGSFTELRELQRWARERGAPMVGTLPLFAAFLDEPFQPSPYSPASRLFLNEAFVDVERAHRVDPAAPTDWAAPPPAGLRRDRFVDYRAAAAAKRAALEPVAERFFGRPRPDSYLRFVEEAPGVREYARFRAEVDRRREWWGAWPADARDGRLRGAPEADPAGRYHLYAQWLAKEQLAEVVRRGEAERRGLYLDLPLGADGAGYDVWRYRAAFAVGSAAGAPPDLFFSGGQDWGFPPLHPERIRQDAYAYPRTVVANLFRFASALRIDHVMGMHRLYWIPRGADPRHGAYVAYQAAEWYALLSIEAHRAGAAIVGEDLGTVPGYVRRAMRRHGVHTSYVIQFEADPARRRLADPPADAAASLGTHDLPPWAAFWAGDDIALLCELGLLDPAEAGERLDERARLRAAIVRGLRVRGTLGRRRSSSPFEVLNGALRFIAESDAALAVVALEDLWLERRPQNVPGTGAELSNWRGRLRLSLEELVSDRRVNQLVRAIGRARADVAARGEPA